jgi:hypothetical protein
MVLVTKRVGFARTKHPPGASPLAMPDGHRLVRAKSPCRNEDSLHMVVPTQDEVSDLPELVAERWQVRQCEAQCQCDG